MHERVQGEWRGLLALLGLRERRAFTGLTVSRVGLEQTLAGSFSAILAHLRPADINLISVATSWDKLYVFRWHQQTSAQGRARAFAFTSPTTLVCTGADYDPVLSAAEIPWFNNGAQKNDPRRLLRDPVNYLSNRERRALAEWLLVVSNQLVELGASSSKENRLIRALTGFVNDLDKSATVPAESSKSLSDSSLGLDHGIYRALNHPRQGEAVTITDVEIVSNRPQAPRYLLIEPSLAQQWNVSPQEITIYRNVTLATASQLTSSANVVLETAEGDRKQVVWCTTEFFFTDRLIYDANPSPAFPGCLPAKFSGNQQTRSVVLPLKPEVLELFTPHEIAERLTIEWLPNGSAMCHLQLLLRSGDGAPRMCRIQRTFTESEMTRVANLPLIGIWPNVRLEGVKWKSYYTFQFWPEGKEELSVRPWSDDERKSDPPRKHAIEPGRRFQVYRTGAHPEALLCETPYYDSTRQREAIAKGILLVQLPRVTQPAPASEIVLGVDFGSTGTNVFIRSGGGEPKAITFEARVRQITDFDIGKFFRYLSRFVHPGQGMAG